MYSALLLSAIWCEALPCGEFCKWVMRIFIVCAPVVDSCLAWCLGSNWWMTEGVIYANRESINDSNTAAHCLHCQTCLDQSYLIVRYLSVTDWEKVLQICCDLFKPKTIWWSLLCALYKMDVHETGFYLSDTSMREST